jgi:hypothetical protein
MKRVREKGLDEKIKRGKRQRYRKIEKKDRERERETKMKKEN